MTPTEKKMFTDTITNVHGLAKGLILLKERLEEAEKHITALRSEMLSMQLRANGNEKPH